MENASEALIMAFAVLVFVLALSVTVAVFSIAKDTADTILYAKDESNFYEYEGVAGVASQNREVGLETIIPTLYKYYKENYTVVFKHGDYNKTTGKFENGTWNKLVVYKTVSQDTRKWRSGYGSEGGTVGLMEKKYGIKNPTENIFSFDLDEETLRNEPWAGSRDRAKQNLDCFINGSIYYNPSVLENVVYIDYGSTPLGSGGFINICRTNNYRFIETITEYNPSGVQDDDEAGKHSGSLTKDKSKRMVIFTKIDSIVE